MAAGAYCALSEVTCARLANRTWYSPTPVQAVTARESRSAIAIAAHPDDIESMMAGTLLLLKRAGYKIHYFNLSTGNCGSVRDSAARTARVRRAESQRLRRNWAKHQARVAKLQAERRRQSA